MGPKQDEQPVRTDQRDGVAVVQIDRPQTRNAMNEPLRAALLDALVVADRDQGVRCIVLTGSSDVFVAGADVKEFAGASTVDMLQRDGLQWWDRLRGLRKPLIAAVNGPALGGGCELAMACDMVIAGEGAQFGQPEVRLGIMPGGGGTQRLVRVAGKAKAMELLLTGRMITAAEAEHLGIVTRLVPDADVLDAAIDLANQIARRPPVAVRLIKDAVQMAHETPLSAGLLHERHNFAMLFATHDKSEGIRGFLEKRRATFKGR